MNLKITLILLFLYIVIPNKAFAYFDPGSGSFLIQIFLAFFASCVVFFRNPITFIKNYLKQKKEKKYKEDKK
ncbi:hypothetical protein N9C36_02825 [Candidatus Pelagibacter sp.]|nr:hypothetical protein [Candidatus Pelagibacter sp.]|tara:strand:- start:414 stop:629 length:216 start_codon:yes stop_codon:yes gene_type:complete